MKLYCTIHVLLSISGGVDMPKSINKSVIISSNLRSALKNCNFIKENEYKYAEVDDSTIFCQRYYILKYVYNLISSTTEIIDCNKYINFLTGLLDKKISYDIRDKFIIRCNALADDENDYETSSYEDRIYLERMTNQLFIELYQNAIDKQLSIMSVEENVTNSKITNIALIFKLDEIEKQLIVFEYLMETHDDFESFINANTKMQRYLHNSITSFKSVARILNVDQYQITQIYSSDSKLIKYGLLTEDTNIASELSAYINGVNDEPLLNNYIFEYKKEFLPLDNFYFENDELTIINTLVKSVRIQKGVKILFYGKPGTGKTELAKSLIKGNDFKAYQIKKGYVNKANNIDANFRMRALNAYENSADSGESFVIVDEADELLTTRSSIFAMYNDNQKGKLNLYLDESETNQIWITNSINEIDASTMRRFDYCLAFPDLNTKQKTTIWGNILKEYQLETIISEQELSSIAEKFECNAGNIRNAVKNFLRFDETKSNKEIFHKIVNSSMYSFLRVFNSEYTIVNKEKSTQKYSEKCLNIDGDLKNYMTIIDNFNEAWKKGDSEIPNMNILMYGPPGTGKTEFARYLSRRLDRKLIIKSPSDLLSKWVGGTEQQIAEAFKNAEKDNGILFIDETDSIVRSRDKAEHSWESTHVNELLMRMENFHGIFISATNRFSDLDQAVIRRFNIKIGFDYLKTEGVNELFNVYFNEMCDLSVNNDKIMQLKHLTPADFKVVYQKLYFMDRKTINTDMIIDMLKSEEHLKEGFIKKKIGFC